jgi:branched-chain amino acid transport system substrate-binding protein
MVMQSRRAFVFSLAGAGAWHSIRIADAQAKESVKIGYSISVTGPFAENGKQMLAASKLFLEQNGVYVAGRMVELIVRDDGGVPDQAKRIAQELVANSKVAMLAGYNPTPNALAVAPISAEAKIPQIVMGGATSIITERSPYIVRTLHSQPQVTIPMAQWAVKSGIKSVLTVVSDYAPGIEAENAFVKEFKNQGGDIVDSLRMPLASTEYAPYLQRAHDAKPEAMFVWVPGGLAGPFLRQYAERGLAASGIKVIGIGDITDDDVLNQMSDFVLGIVTSMPYSAAHPSEKNRKFVEDFKRVSGGLRPDHIGVAAYDGLTLIFEALRKTGGNADGDALLATMKGMSWESPRGPVSIDPATRDIVQDVYIRRVERLNGELYNVEFDKYQAVRDPHTAA